MPITLASAWDSPRRGRSGSGSAAAGTARAASVTPAARRRGGVMEASVAGDVEQLDAEDQGLVGADGALALGAIAQLGGNHDLPGIADAHQLQRLLPAVDHLVDAKAHRLAALIGAVEDGAVDQGALVVYLDAVLGPRCGAVAGLQHPVLQAGLGHLDALRLGVGGQVGLAFGAVGLGLLLGLGLAGGLGPLLKAHRRPALPLAPNRSPAAGEAVPIRRGEAS